MKTSTSETIAPLILFSLSR